MAQAICLPHSIAENAIEWATREQDGLGSITSLTSTTGALPQTYTYDSFGNDLTSSGSLINPTRYTGRDFDTETNLQFSRARYYDPRVGRFLNEDPSGFDSGQSNFFVYVGNNSVNLVDPSGLLKVCCRDAHQFAAHFWATLNGGPAPCHCFLKLSDGRTLGGYHDWSLSGTMGGLVLRPDDVSDHAKYANDAQCTDIQGNDCDQRAKNGFDKVPRKLGGYGFSRYDYGTSNDAAARILKDAGIAYTLPGCAWGKGTGKIPNAVTVVSTPWGPNNPHYMSGW